MLQDNKIETCPICGDDYVIDLKLADKAALLYQFQCERCGTYLIHSNLISATHKPWSTVRHLVSAWIRRENQAGIIPVIGRGSTEPSSPEWADQFRHMGFPQTTNEKMDALLLAYADTTEGNYQKSISYGMPGMIAAIAGKNIDEVNGLTDFLKEVGYIDNHPRITAAGWTRVDALRKAAISGDSAFIAMWFSDETRKYREAVVTAVNYCGYKAVIVDQQDYNDFIMDQVRSLIRQARFLVADFTAAAETIESGHVRNGVRGGVYWEAGMAYGLDKPVIHTCKDNKDSKQRLHFDVSQYNTIFWKESQLGNTIRPLDETPEQPNFAERLAARILATIGRGSYVSK